MTHPQWLSEELGLIEDAQRERLLAELTHAQSWDAEPNDDEQVHFQLGYIAALKFALGLPAD